MADPDRLMFRREHFPISLDESNGQKGEMFWDFRRIEIAPYHKSMAENGINFEVVPELLGEVVEATVKDLEGIADKMEGYVKMVLQERFSKPEIVEQDDSGIIFESVPVVDRFYVGRKKINPYSYSGDQGISINPEVAAKSFMVPEEVTFTPELMREYEMTEKDVFLGRKRIACPNLWYRHNLGRTNAIFYKNLVIALDNAAVREKYAEKPPV
jgi:hypothetical protein